MHPRHLRPFKQKAHLIAFPGILTVGMLVSPGMYLVAGAVLTAAGLACAVAAVGLAVTNSAEI